MQPLVARFSEHERYDINDDTNKIVIMATTSEGSFWTEIPNDRKAYERRRIFKDRVAELMADGYTAGEISFGD